MAQSPVNFKSPNHEYQLAMELFNKEKYGSAQQYFKYVYENSPDKQDDIKSNSYFYMGVCGAYLLNNDATFLLKDFITKYPVHSFVPEANYFIGKLFFNNKQYKKALDYYNLIDERDIKKEDLAEFHFKKGYCYFDAKKNDEAKVYFDKALNESGDYRLRAIYYLGNIAYQEEQYQSSLDYFMQLRDEPEYAETIPLYIAQIYFYQQNYSDIIKIVPPLLTKVSSKNQDELNRILGLSYYALGQYDKSISYFTAYTRGMKTQLDRNDCFAIGYSFYQTKKYDEAVEFLSKATNEKDFMTQNSYYIIADCYLNINQMNLAAQSFFEASKLDFDKEIKEDALYNYAKLQYASSSAPFNTAIKALENYVNAYPNSSRSEEAMSYLSMIYFSTKNYQAAVTSLENIQSKNPELLRAYQKCTYYRALELTNAKKNREAIILLNKSLEYQMDKSIRLSALYWKAECEYRNEQNKDAYFDFQVYQKQDNVKKNEYYSLSLYSLGYSAFKINRYADSRSAFENFLATKYAKEDDNLMADAYARIADSYYMEKNPSKAIPYYDKCAKLNQSNADYALYQQALCQGYLKNDKKKIELLQKLIDTYTQSAYLDEASVAIADAYHAQNNYTMAISEYKSFINRYPKSKFIRQAHNKLAQSYLNIDEVDQSIATYKYVIENYPGSQESKDAISNLETIYTELGNTTDFFAYVRNKNVNVSVTRQDSVSWKAAENKYLKGDCEAAIKQADDYIKEFPDGQFIAIAYFYKAECEYGLNRFTDALSDYEVIISRYKTEYNEIALRKSASILYNAKNYDKAQNYYKKLSETTSDASTQLIAQSGIMYTAYFLKNYSNALNAAKRVLEAAANDEELKNEAKIIAGRSAIELKDYSSAKTSLHELATNYANEFAAEAAYLSCLIEYELGNLDQCEKRIIDMLSANYTSGSEYWFASVFILYGDFYVAKGNYFQARHTYQSILDNYEGDDFKEIAAQKIAALDALEGE
jgi:tetratricopeptide (TPR) repeat protein